VSDILLGVLYHRVLLVALGLGISSNFATKAAQVKVRIAAICVISVVILHGDASFRRNFALSDSSKAFSPILSPRFREAYRQFQTLEYGKALTLYQQAAEEALAQKNSREAAIAFQNCGACLLKLTKYRRAAGMLARARELATRAGDRDLACMIAANLSSLQLSIGDVGSAVAEALAARKLLGSGASPALRAAVFAQMGAAMVRAKDMKGAHAAFREALFATNFSDDSVLAGRILDAFGAGLQDAGDYGAAESLFTEAFRIRWLRAPKDLPISWARLGILRLKRGDPEGACRFLERCLANVRGAGMAWPEWVLRYYLARASLEAGHYEEALRSFRDARAAALRWRQEVPPSDVDRIRADVTLQDLYEGYLHTAILLYTRTGKGELAQDVFVAGEENRAASLRESLAGAGQALPDEYWELVARLRAADGQVSSDVKQSWSLRMREMEEKAGLLSDGRNALDSRPSVSALQKKMSEQDALIGFVLGEHHSHFYSVTRDRIYAGVIPPRSVLAPLAIKFSEAVRGHQADRYGSGAALMKALLAPLPEAVHCKRRWKLALDDALFQVPFAALPQPGYGNQASYLIERHTLEIVPGALHGVRYPARSGRRLFAGFADPVYNLADPRLITDAGWAARADAAPRALLNRLVGSREEVVACAREWEGPARLAFGPEVTRQRVANVLKEGPEVVHFAVHVTGSGEPPEGLRLALSLGPSGEADFLDREDIRKLESNVELVTLSGCSSGWGEVKRGAGMIGLARAWLQAGARSVVASLWPTPDDNGEMFRVFYRQLAVPSRGATSKRVGEALRAAQVAMIQSGGWRAEPRYWSAYCAVSTGVTQ